MKKYFMLSFLFCSSALLPSIDAAEPHYSEPISKLSAPHDVFLLDFLNTQVRSITVSKWSSTLPENYKPKIKPILLEENLSKKIGNFLSILKETKDGIVFELLLKNAAILQYTEDNLLHALRLWCAGEKIKFDLMKKQSSNICPTYLRETLSPQGLLGKIDPHFVHMSRLEKNDFFQVCLLNFFTFRGIKSINPNNKLNSFISFLYFKAIEIKKYIPAYNNAQYLWAIEEASLLIDLERGTPLTQQEGNLQKISHLKRYIINILELKNYHELKNSCEFVFAILFLCDYIVRIDENKVDLSAFDGIVSYRKTADDVENRFELIKNLYEKFQSQLQKDKLFGLRVFFEQKISQIEKNASKMVEWFDNIENGISNFNPFARLTYLTMFFSEYLLRADHGSAFIKMLMNKPSDSVHDQYVAIQTSFSSIEGSINLEKLRQKGVLKDSTTITERIIFLIDIVKEMEEIPTISQEIKEQAKFFLKKLVIENHFDLSEEDNAFVFGENAYTSKDRLTILEAIIDGPKNFYEHILVSFFFQNVDSVNIHIDIFSKIKEILAPIIKNSKDIYFKDALIGMNFICEGSFILYNDHDKKIRYPVWIDVVSKLHDVTVSDEKSMWHRTLTLLNKEYKKILMPTEESNLGSDLIQELQTLQRQIEAEQVKKEQDERKFEKAKIRALFKIEEQTKDSSSDCEEEEEKTQRLKKKDRSSFVMLVHKDAQKSISTLSAENYQIFQTITEEIRLGNKSSRERGKLVNSSYLHDGKRHPIYHCSLIGADRLFYSYVAGMAMILQVGGHDLNSKFVNPIK